MRKSNITVFKPAPNHERSVNDTAILNLTLSPMIRTWHFLVANAVFNVCVVALLTWAVMPLVTRALHGWLQPRE